MTYPGNKNAFKALIAAQYVGVKIDVPPFQMGVDNKTPEFLQKNPFGQVPVLCTENGAVFESNAIARYVARLGDVGLFGSTPEEKASVALDGALSNLRRFQAKVDQWIDFATLSIDAPLLSWVSPLMFPEAVPYDKKVRRGV